MVAQAGQRTAPVRQARRINRELARPQARQDRAVSMTEPDVGGGAGPATGWGGWTQVHPEIFGDVLPAVPPRRRVDGVEPDRGSPQVGQVVEPGDQALDITDPVAVGVLEEADIK